MADNTKDTQPIPNNENSVAGGASYYEAATRVRRANVYPALLRGQDSNGRNLSLINPEPVRAVFFNKGVSGGVTTLSVEYAQQDTNPYNDAYVSGDRGRECLLLTASGFDDFPFINGRTFVCRMFSNNFHLLGVNTDPGTPLGDLPVGRTPTSGYFGVNFMRIHKGDPQGKYHLEWDGPLNADGTSQHVDYYNVYQRNGSIWGFIGSTDSTEIYIDNVEADIDRGLQVHAVPLASDVQEKDITSAQSSRNYTLGTEGISAYNAIPNIPDQIFDPYPQCSAFWAQRQFYLGSLREPETFHGSKTGQFYNFSYSQPRQDDDAIERQIASGIAQEIRHALPLADLLVFTSRGEYRIGAQGTGAVTPISITASPQSFQGASHVPPVRARDKIVVVERGGKRINDYRFEEEADTYTGEELTILATHLFDENRIVDMAYHEGNTSLLFVITDRGKLLVQTKDEALEISGWTEWLTQGLFRSVSVARTNNNTSSVFFVIERETKEGQKYFATERIEFDAVNTKNAWADSGKAVSEKLGDAVIEVEGPDLLLSGIDLGVVGEEPIEIFLTGLRTSGMGVHGPFDDKMPLSDTAEIQDNSLYARGRPLDGKYTLHFSEAAEPTGRGEVDRYIPGPVEVWKPIKEVTGLHHLEGREVSIGVDGSSAGTRTVENGRVDGFNGREVNVGLEYRFLIKTLPISTFDQDEPEFYAITRKCTRIVVDTGDTSGGQVAQTGGLIPRASEFNEIGDHTDSAKVVEMTGEHERDLSIIFTQAEATPFRLRRFSAFINTGQV